MLLTLVNSSPCLAPSCLLTVTGKRSRLSDQDGGDDDDYYPPHDDHYESDDKFSFDDQTYDTPQDGMILAMMMNLQ